MCIFHEFHSGMTYIHSKRLPHESGSVVPCRQEATDSTAVQDEVGIAGHWALSRAANLKDHKCSGASLGIVLPQLGLLILDQQKCSRMQQKFQHTYR